MDKIAIHNLFGIEGMDVAWYGIIIAAGIIVGVAVAVLEARRRGYTAELLLDFMILALPLAIVGARLYYVAFEWEFYSQHPEKIFAIWEGGMAIYGAVIGGIVAAIILAKWRKFPLGRILDIGSTGLIIGQAIGRWGNFVNQEAFGNLVTDPSLQYFPYAVQVDSHFYAGVWHYDAWFQATFFYESMWDVGVFVLLLLYARRAKYDGNVFAMYLIAYGVGRFWIEGVRIQTLTVGGMPVSQLLSAVLIVIGLLYIIIRRVRKKENALYEGRYVIGFEATEKETEAQEKKAEKAFKKKLKAERKAGIANDAKEKAEEKAERAHEKQVKAEDKAKKAEEKAKKAEEKAEKVAAKAEKKAEEAEQAEKRAEEIAEEAQGAEDWLKERASEATRDTDKEE